jgi:hypothetical protein
MVWENNTVVLAARPKIIATDITARQPRSGVPFISMRTYASIDLLLAVNIGEKMVHPSIN